MTAKLLTTNSTSETSLVLPQLLNAGLAANDRLKYFLTLLQVAGAPGATLAARAFNEKPHELVERVESLWRAARDRRPTERRRTWRRAA